MPRPEHTTVSGTGNPPSPAIEKAYYGPHAPGPPTIQSSYLKLQGMIAIVYQCDIQRMLINIEMTLLLTLH